MSDTPRTDHMQTTQPMAATNFARQLERELNEAKLNTEAIVADFRSIKEERDRLRAELEKVREERKTTCGESLIAAIEGNRSKMAHSDLVLTCEMLENGRAIWRKEAEQWHAMAKELATLCLKHENIDSNITRGLARFNELEKSI